MADCDQHGDGSNRSNIYHHGCDYEGQEPEPSRKNPHKRKALNLKGLPDIHHAPEKAPAATVVDHFSSLYGLGYSGLLPSLRFPLDSELLRDKAE